jgi:hypothetical protein
MISAALSHSWWGGFFWGSIVSSVLSLPLIYRERLEAWAERKQRDDG